MIKLKFLSSNYQYTVKWNFIPNFDRFGVSQPKFYLPITLIVADLLCKAVNTLTSSPTKCLHLGSNRAKFSIVKS